MHRFFVNSEQIRDSTISIIGKDVNHIKNVLRLSPGDKLEVVSHNIVYLCSLKDFLDEELVLKIISKAPGTNEPDVELVLYQALAKGSKMDLIIQKGTEIGVRDFYGVSTKRAVVRLDNEKKKRSRIKRWNTIAQEAAKQAKRDYIPEVKGILTFEEMLECLKGEDNIIVPYEAEENNSIGHSLKNIKNGRINLIIGPEGGFEKEEIKRLEEYGAKIVTLGPRILRTETAGLVAATIILYKLGDLGVI